jgi:ABC-2 type transport system permease protein
MDMRTVVQAGAGGAQAILYRGAGFDIVWREFAVTSAIGAVCFVGALRRFRKVLTAVQ